MQTLTPCPHRKTNRCLVASSLARTIAVAPDQACAACQANDHPRTVNEITLGLAFHALLKAGRRDQVQELMRIHGHRLPRADDAVQSVLHGTGVGSQLWRLLESLGVKLSARCDCLAWARKLNDWGPAGCRLARAEITDHLRTARAELGWSAAVTAAVAAVRTGLAWRINPIDPYGSLVDEAIRRAEEAASHTPP